MPALTCPYCSAYSNFTERAVLMDHHMWRAYRPAEGLVNIVAWSCDNCAGPIVGGRMIGDRTGLLWHEPKKSLQVDFPDVPESIAADASEAHRCLGVDAWRATVAIARRAVQAAAFDKGAPDKKLFDQIDWLHDQRIITPQMRDIAHHIRLSGNDGAHPDKDGLQEVGKEAAEAALEFLDDFLRHLYQMPARLERARSKVVEAPDSRTDVVEPASHRFPPVAG